MTLTPEEEEELIEQAFYEAGQRYVRPMGRLYPESLVRSLEAERDAATARATRAAVYRRAAIERGRRDRVVADGSFQALLTVTQALQAATARADAAEGLAAMLEKYGKRTSYLGIQGTLEGRALEHWWAWADDGYPWKPAQEALAAWRAHSAQAQAQGGNDAR